MAISTEEQTELLKIVTGLFNGAPGATFLPELEAFIEGGGTQQQLARELAANALFTDTVLAGATTSAEKAAILAGNFDLTEDGVEGSPASRAIAHFTDGIDAGLDIGDLVYEAVVFLSDPDLDSAFTETATLLSNKAAVAAAYSATKGSSDLAVLQAALSTVTGTAALTTEEIDAIVAAADPIAVDPSVGTTFTLTNSATADVVTGTALNDTITGDAGTLQTGDVITDGSTTDADVLNVTVSSYDATVVPTIANIETLNITGSFASTGLMLTNVINATTVNVDSGITTGTATVAGVSATKVGTIAAGANVNTLNVLAVATGTAGDVAVNAGTAAKTVVLTGGAADDSFTLTAVAGSTLTVTEATTGTDSYTLNLNGGANKLTVTTAGGTIENLSVGSSTAANTLTLQNANPLSGVASSNGVTLTGDQNLTIVGDLDSISSAAATTNVKVTDSTTAGTTTFKSNAGATNGFVNRAAFDVLEVVTAATGADLTLNTATTLKLSIDNGTQVYNVDNATGTLTTGTLNATIDENQASITTGAKVANLTVAAGTKAIALTILDTAAASADGTATSFTGAKNVTVSTWTHDNTDVLSASALTGKLTVATTTTAVTGTILGGSGDDSITTHATAGNFTILGGAGADTITSGSGADTLDGGDGNDILTGGAGIDTLIGGAGNDKFINGDLSANGNDTITDFTSGSDTLTITDAAVNGAKVEVTAAGAALGAATTARIYVVEQTVGAAGSLTTGGTATISDFTDVAQVSAFIDEYLTNAAAAEVAVILNNGTTSYIYDVVDVGADATTSGEVTLTGTVTGIVLDTDIALA